MVNKINNIILTLIIILSTISCEKTYDSIPPSVSIARIYNITNNSAQIDLNITNNTNGIPKQGNLYLNIDSISKSGNDTVCQKDTIYSFDTIPQGMSGLVTVKISNLRENTKYLVSIWFEDHFKISDEGGGMGDNPLYEDRTLSIGEIKTFTTY
jgi:hypothetical protein